MKNGSEQMNKEKTKNLAKICLEKNETVPKRGKLFKFTIYQLFLSLLISDLVGILNIVDENRYV